MKFYTYAAPAVLGLLFSFMGITFAMTGGVQGLYLVGGLLILAYTGTVAYVVKMDKAGKGTQSAYLLALPMIMVTGVMMATQIGMQTVSWLTPDSEVFISNCKTTGVEFFKPPTLPVRSLAYEWNGKIQPPFIQFEVSGTRITSSSYTNIPVDAKQGIDFIEIKTSYEGRTAQAPAYLKFNSPGNSQGVAVSTADVLVSYRISPEEELKKAYPEQGMVRYELSVIDRRIGNKLATKSYIVDAKKGRACGPKMSDRSFILSALGLSQGSH